MAQTRAGYSNANPSGSFSAKQASASKLANSVRWFSSPYRREPGPSHVILHLQEHLFHI